MLIVVYSSNGHYLLLSVHLLLSVLRIDVMEYVKEQVICQGQVKVVLHTNASNCRSHMYIKIHIYQCSSEKVLIYDLLLGLIKYPLSPRFCIKHLFQIQSLHQMTMEVRVPYPLNESIIDF